MREGAYFCVNGVIHTHSHTSCTLLPSNPILLVIPHHLDGGYVNGVGQWI